MLAVLSSMILTFIVLGTLSKNDGISTTMWSLDDEPSNESDSERDVIRPKDAASSPTGTPSCFQPLATTIGPGFHDSLPNRIINVGMPKTGSTSLQNLFIQSGLKYSNSYQNARHFHCGRDVGPCGACIQRAIKAGQPPLATCGNHTVWTQLDYPTYNDCYFPQVSALAEMIKESPDAVLLLPMRNVTSWINSVTKWGDMRSILTRRCDIPGLKRFEGFYDVHFERFLCGHVKNVRELAKKVKTLTLIEFSIEDENVGRYLASKLPGLDEKLWSRSNVGPYYIDRKNDG